MKHLIGNWKMNTTLREGVELARRIAGSRAADGRVKRVVCPPFIALAAVRAAVEGSAVGVGAQSGHSEPKGAFTGEVAMEMLRGLADYVIVGHSERRTLFNESSATVASKVAAAQRAGLVAVVCVGEDAAQRGAGAGRAEETVAAQVRDSLPQNTDWENLIVAYEPLWSIGSGVTPTTEQVDGMGGAIRATLEGLQQGGASATPPILYGGSVAPGNAAELTAAPRVDGFLVGGASLDADRFDAIARAMIG